MLRCPNGCEERAKYLVFTRGPLGGELLVAVVETRCGSADCRDGKKGPQPARKGSLQSETARLKVLTYERFPQLSLFTAPLLHDRGCLHGWRRPTTEVATTGGTSRSHRSRAVASKVKHGLAMDDEQSTLLMSSKTFSAWVSASDRGGSRQVVLRSFGRHELPPQQILAGVGLQRLLLARNDADLRGWCPKKRQECTLKWEDLSFMLAQSRLRGDDSADPFNYLIVFTGVCSDCNRKISRGKACHALLTGDGIGVHSTGRTVVRNAHRMNIPHYVKEFEKIASPQEAEDAPAPPHRTSS
jgi:hypothetical protein